jgi:hypothetical protein
MSRPDLQAAPVVPADVITRWHGPAFGLELDSGFPLPGLAESVEPASEDAVRVELVDAPALEASWSDAPARRLTSLEDDDGTPLSTFDVSQDGDFRLWGHERGTFLIAADGRRVACAPSVEGWAWRRFFVGQVLPFVATLNGIVTMHASAVAFGDRAVAFTGPSRSGKSSVAAQLVLGGADLLADDVIALTVGPRGLVAHPGLPAVVIRRSEWERMTAAERDRVGDVIADGEIEVVVHARAQRRPLELASVYMFDTQSTPSGPLRFERESHARQLLATSFVNVTGSPEHLLRLLDICARMSTTASVAHAIVPSGVDAGALAAAIREREEHAA